MGTLTYTNVLVDGNTGLGVKIMQNFTDALTVLNGGLDEDNLAEGADLHVASMEANTAAVVAEMEPAVVAHESYVDLPTVETAMLEVTDADDNVLFQIDVDGDVVVGPSEA